MTLADIARRAGVSRTAVSHALKGSPGISADLRRHIIGIAVEAGYQVGDPPQTAPGPPAKAIGLVLPRSSAALSVEVFRRQLIAGIQAELSIRSSALALQFVTDLAEETLVYRRWSADGWVDGVLIVDPLTEDPRIAVVRQLDLPAALIGGAPDSGLPGVLCDDTSWTADLVAHLAELGHRRIARVSGPPGLVHTGSRDAAFKASSRALGIRATIIRADFTGAAGARRTRELLGRRLRPTAIVYDNEVMAIAGLAVADELGAAVPADLSIAACEDSPMCEVVDPPLTAIGRDIAGYGSMATAQLFAVLAGETREAVRVGGGRLEVRRSTGPARAG